MQAKKYIQKYPLYQNKYLVFNNLSKFPDLMQFVSTRLGGVSQEPCDALNIGFSTNDSSENVLKNRGLLAESLAISLQNFCIPQQTHNSHCQVIVKSDAGRGVLEKQTGFAETDSLVSNEKDVCLLVQSADCVPILMYDAKNRVISATHAGWRGTVQKIVLNALETMKRNYYTQPQDVWVGIGASISSEFYEVGQEVVEAVERAFQTKEKYLCWNAKTQKYHLDLWYANQQPLVEAGVPLAQIEIMGICTQKNSDAFFSSRVSKGNTGRFAAGIMIKS